ncbi:hypothetical protein Pfo_013572 [Paulownia fortunei]|nr:hypothetical protein Pfo_013572 [Paulownia fortunei]
MEEVNFEEKEMEAPPSGLVPAALHEQTVLSCSFGWLVLFDDDDSELFSLCNFSTFDTIPLPALELSQDSTIDSCILSSSPNSPDCKVLLLFEEVQSIIYCRLGDEEWSEIRYGEQLKPLDPRNTDHIHSIDGTLFFCEPVSCGGKIYAKLIVREPCGSVCYRQLWSIEIVEEPVGLVLSRLDNTPEFNHEHSSRVTQYVVESDGELFCVRFGWGGIELRDILVVEVCKLSWDTMVWERVESLKDRSFFSCPDYCSSVPTPGFGCIFFTMCEDQSVYSYNMEDESVMVSLPCPDLPTPWLYPVLMMPEVLIRPEDFCNYSKEGQNDTGSLDLKEIIQEDLGKKGPSPDQEKQLLDIPFHVLQQVTKHLLPLDYMNFGAVSRMCRSLAPPVNWRTALSGSETNISFPLLIHHSSLFQSRLAVTDEGPCYSSIQSVHRDTSSYTDAWEPEENLFFASKPSGSACLLIGISFCFRKSVNVSILYPGTNDWTRHEFENGLDFESTYNSPVFFQDAFYYLDQNGILGRFKLEEVDCSWEVMEEPQRPCDSFHHNFLVECGGDLLSVFVGHVGKWVLVYKLNQSTRAWETVTSLNNYTLYLSRSSSFSAAANPGVDNRIYFPRFRGCGIVFYSLDTGKWHFSGSQDSSSDFYGSTESSINQLFVGSNMATFKASVSSFSSSSFLRTTIKAGMQAQKLHETSISVANHPITDRRVHLNKRIDSQTMVLTTTGNQINVIKTNPRKEENSNSCSIEQLYAIMEIVADRVEMHKNIGEQRNNWNHLFLTSVNGMILTAATMTGLAAVSGEGSALLALKISSTLLYLGATGILIIMNKIQPSQLAEEQRNASRLFKQLHQEIKSTIALKKPTSDDVKRITEKVLALDKAYPLPLLGAMLDKFPKQVEPAVWWPQHVESHNSRPAMKAVDNGWSQGLEEEMREVISVLRRKDDAEYVKLGKMVLKINKILAICGPLFTGLAATGPAFMGSPFLGSVPAFFGAVFGALAVIVNTLEHGGQMGMVFEMYRSSAGFFRFMEESIESALEEKQVQRRENGEVFEARVALELGRNLSELRDLAGACCTGNPNTQEEFASKLF